MASLRQRSTGAAFIMLGGKISGNTANNGGGVFRSSGTVRIETGTIYGINEANEALRNTAPANAALFAAASTEHGTFSGTTWNSNGTLTSTDYTVKVVSGVVE